MYLALIVLPLLASIVSGFFGRKIGVSGAHLITCTSVIATTILALLTFIEVGLNNIPVKIYLFRWIDTELLNVSWSFSFDALTVSMLIPVLIISSLVHVYSIGYMSHDPHNQRFFSYLSLFTFMMIILVTGDNYVLMFVGWEGVGVCSYLLVSFWFTRTAANQSSLAAFLTNRVGDAVLTIGMFAILCSFGNIDYSTVFSLAPYYNESTVAFIGICLLIGAMAKSSQVGLHVWLPMAMEGPTPVSALIHAATMVTAGVYLLMRSSPLIEHSSTVLLLCLWVGAVTTVFSSLVGLFQQDIKKVIAYSTMSQLGMMVIAIGLSSYNIALFHLINHAFYKGLLFLGAGAVIHAVADNQDFRKYGGLIYYLPLTYSVMLIASLSLVAFPFMTGFYSKDFILESAFGRYHLSSITVYFIAVIGAMFTTLYSVKVLYLTFLSNPNGPLTHYRNPRQSVSSASDGDIFMSIPLIILAVFSIFFGYITKDIFIGLGSDFFKDNSLYIHPKHEIMLDTEFNVPIIYKLSPLFLTIVLTIISILFTEFYPKSVISFKYSVIGYNIFGFLNQRFLVESYYNKYVSGIILELGAQTTKVMDKGVVEIFGPYGLEKRVTQISKQIDSLSSGLVTTYALYILTGLIFYVSIMYFTGNTIYFFLHITMLFALVINLDSSTKFHIETLLIINKGYSKFLLTLLYIIILITGIIIESLLVISRKCYSKFLNRKSYSKFLNRKSYSKFLFIILYIIILITVIIIQHTGEVYAMEPQAEASTRPKPKTFMEFLNPGKEPWFTLSKTVDDFKLGINEYPFGEINTTYDVYGYKKVCNIKPSFSEALYHNFERSVYNPSARCLGHLLYELTRHGKYTLEYELIEDPRLLNFMESYRHKVNSTVTPYKAEDVIDISQKLIEDMGQQYAYNKYLSIKEDFAAADAKLVLHDQARLNLIQQVNQARYRKELCVNNLKYLEAQSNSLLRPHNLKELWDYGVNELNQVNRTGEVLKDETIKNHDLMFDRRSEWARVKDKLDEQTKAFNGPEYNYEYFKNRLLEQRAIRQEWGKTHKK